jgi:hypothetical protein
VPTFSGLPWSYQAYFCLFIKEPEDVVTSSTQRLENDSISKVHDSLVWNMDPFLDTLEYFV